MKTVRSLLRIATTINVVKIFCLNYKKSILTSDSYFIIYYYNGENMAALLRWSQIQFANHRSVKNIFPQATISQCNFFVIILNRNLVSVVEFFSLKDIFIFFYILLFPNKFCFEVWYLLTELQLVSSPRTMNHELILEKKQQMYVCKKCHMFNLT